MSEPKQVGILVIATRKYKQYFQQLIDSLAKHFLINHKIEIHLFTDSYEMYNIPDRIKIINHPIISYGFPEATLMRYHIFTAIAYPGCDYLYYLDVDMRLEQNVDNEILRDLVAVYHPGFYRGGGSWETNEVSTAYMEPKDRVSYYAGGFQGGSNKVYYNARLRMKANIQKDLDNKVTACWHDESHWNKHVAKFSGDLIELSPSYCMVEEKELRKQWKIENFPAKIVALQKDHKTIRE